MGVPMSVKSPRSPAWEQTLRDRLVAGDEAALCELYDQFASFVFGLAVRVTNDHRAAEDVAQEVFIQVWERPASFDPSRGTMRAWLGTLPHPRAVGWVRRGGAGRPRAPRGGR